jgi:hypothetical protein
MATVYRYRERHPADEWTAVGPAMLRAFRAAAASSSGPAPPDDTPVHASSWRYRRDTDPDGTPDLVPAAVDPDLIELACEWSASPRTPDVSREGHPMSPEKDRTIVDARHF